MLPITLRPPVDTEESIARIVDSVASTHPKLTVGDAHLGMGGSRVSLWTVPLLAMCLLAGVLVGCAGDEPSEGEGGGSATDQQSRTAEVNPGADVADHGSGPSRPEPGQGSNGQDDGTSRGDPGVPSGRGAGAERIPPGVLESRLTGIAEGLPGQIGIAVSGPGGPGPPAVLGELNTGPALATITLPIAERVLEDGSGPSGVGAQAREQIEAAISRSDAKAVQALLSRLESTHRGPAGASQALEQRLRGPGIDPGTVAIPPVSTGGCPVLVRSDGRSGPKLARWQPSPVGALVLRRYASSCSS
jgi:hypothetical protein